MKFNILPLTGMLLGMYYNCYYNEHRFASSLWNHYVNGKTESVLLRKGLSIYKQPLSKGRGSPNWYARVYMPINGRSIHARSTGTTDLKQAERFAEEFYGDCLIERKTLDGELPRNSGIGSNGVVRFDRIADQFLNQLCDQAGSDSRRLRNWKDHKGSLLGQGGLATFFKRQDINTISTGNIKEYLSFQVSKSRKQSLAPSSQKRTLSTLSSVLRFAYENQILSKLPLMPRLKMKDSPRPWFELKEYQKLYKTAFALRDAAKRRGDSADHLKWSELGDFIVFMVNSFLRPSEWANLTNAHITKVEGEHRYLEIWVDQGKTGDRRAITMEPAVDVYKRIVKRIGDSPNAYLFKPTYANRQTAKERMADDFAALLKATGLAHNSFGKKRSLYSLRHTALMLRITRGKVQIINLAKNAGTSIEMLQRFYLKNLVLRNSVEDIQSFMGSGRDFR